MKSEDQIRAEVRRFVVENFLMGDASAMPADHKSLVETGTIDSTGVLEVVTFLESSFGFEIEDRELIPENIDSVDNQVKFIFRKLGAA